MGKCVICGEDAPLGVNKKPRMLCLKKECKSEYSRRTIAASFAKHGGQITKFRKTNGMVRPEVREKVSFKLRAMGWKPPVRGGNGHGPTLHEQRLASALGMETSVVVKTGKPRGSEFPQHYKLDIGSHELRLGIEVDGQSHGVLERKRQDRKKENFLRSIGWTVLRFSNAEVDKNLTGCVQAVQSTILKLKATITTSQTLF